jgi:hypothetical protein
MGLIGSIQKKFIPAVKPEPEEKNKEVQEEPRAELVADHTCTTCSSNDWWQPIGASGSFCFFCQRPSSISLVGSHFFFDDLGVRWFIEVDSVGCEVWTKEGFLA